ncbi:MAG: type II secretory pathway protein [Bilifractor sp.]|nr:type II secretory pathway protein [Lachnospiraceae bacterium]MDY2838263.1 type II secretory pathway protein [Bilifractor sp.]
MSVVLVGQTELWDQKLRLQLYAAIEQRIDTVITLNRLDRADTAKYMAVHLAYAGGKQDIFTSDAEDQIYKVSSGIPRMINRICGKALMYAYQQQKRLIDGHMVRYVADHEMVRGCDH